MKFKPDKKYINMGIIAFIVAVCIILFVFAVFNYPVFAAGFSNFIKVLSPVINGFLIAYLLNPVMVFCEKKFIPGFLRLIRVNDDFCKKHRKAVRYISIFLTVIFTLLCITFFLVMMIPQLISSISSIARQMPEYAQNAYNFLSRVFDDDPRIQGLINDYYEDIQEWSGEILGKVPNYINQVFNTVSSGIIKSVSFVWNLVLGLILSIYILSLKESFLSQSRKIVIAYFSRRRAKSILMEAGLIDGIFRDYIVSSIVDSIIIGIICFVLCTIIRIPYSTLISFIVGITNIIPFFGPFIGAIPSVIIIFMIEPIKALYFLILIVLLQQFDGNVLKPKLFGDSTGLPAFWVVVSIIVGGGLFGVMGMYLGTPVFAVIYLNIKRNIAGKLRAKGLPSDTMKYMKPDELPFESIKKEEGSGIAERLKEAAKTSVRERIGSGHRRNNSDPAKGENSDGASQSDNIESPAKSGDNDGSARNDDFNLEEEFLNDDEELKDNGDQS